MPASTEIGRLGSGMTHGNYSFSDELVSTRFEIDGVCGIESISIEADPEIDYYIEGQEYKVWLKDEYSEI